MLSYYDLVLALVNAHSGRRCRTCGAEISPRDHFGVSEGICPGCRS
jgi:hypothetical protein